MPKSIVEDVYKFRRSQYENLRAAKWVVENPKRIFEGLRLPDDEDGWCYVARPKFSYFVPKGQTEAVAKPLREGFVFCVFVNDRLEIYKWYMSENDTRDRFSPKGFKERFKELKWSDIS